jgi:hypothetical protein
LLRYIGAAERDEIRAQMVYEIEGAGDAEARVRQDYTGRYPIELLQNAHDACADADARGAVRFAVTNSALLIANEGVPFTAERVHSLVRLGGSTKGVSRGRRHTIGYKGVGFTAVFEISDRPQVISETVAFEFDRRRAATEVQRVLGFKPRSVPARGYPFRLSDESWAEDAALIRTLLRSGAVTVIRLPLRRDHGPHEVAEQLAETIPAESLLFMPSISDLEMILPDRTERWTKRLGARIGPGRVIHLSSSARRASWLVATTHAAIPRSVVEALDDRLWADVRQVQAAVAIPWKRGPDPSTGPQPIHVYFPTDDELGRAVLIHGDFYVDSSRRHVQRSGAGWEIGRRVAATAARLAASLAEALADRGHPMLACFAKTGDAAGFGTVMGEFLEDELARARIVRPGDGGDPRRPGGMRRLVTGSARFDHELMQLMASTRDLVHAGDDDDPVDDLLEALDVQELEWIDIAQRIDLSRVSVPEDRALSVLVRLLDRIPPAERSAVVSALRDSPLLRDAEGRLQKPSKLLMRRADSPDLPIGLRRPELVLGRSRHSRSLATALQVDELTPRKALDIVIRAVRAGRFGRSNSQAKRVHDFALEAWIHSRTDVQAEKRRMGTIRVPARRARGRRREWVPADQVYFPVAWTGDRLLEGLYGRFGKPEFLAVARPAEANAASSLGSFYALLGVARRPRVQRHIGERTYGTWTSAPWRDSLIDWDQWLELTEVQAAMQCDAGHEYSGRHVALAVLDRLDGLLSRADREVGATLARHLNGSSNPFGPDADISCTNTSHGGGAPRKRAIGYQRWRLTTIPWVPVRGDPTGAELRTPGRAWTGHVPSDLVVPRAALKADSVHGLGLIHADRPGVRALEHALEELHDLFPELEAAAEDVQRTAAWLAGRLDRSSRQTAEQSVDVPPLPSHSHGQPVWSRSPLIQDLTGLTVVELEVLPEGPWQGLRRRYGLKRASEIVDPEVVPGHPIRSRRVLSRDAQAQLAALLATQGGDADRVATRLARVREHPVAHLTVRYAVGGRRLGDPVITPFFLSLQRDRRGAIRGATLFVTPALDAAARITLARDFANYLDVPDLQHAIALFLTNSTAVLESEQISADDIIEAGRRVESHRRTKDAADAEDRAQDVAELLGDSVRQLLNWDEDDEQGASGEVPVTDEAPRAHIGNESTGTEAREEPLPELDIDSVTAADVVGGELSNEQALEPSGRPSGLGGGMPIDWERVERERRRFGRRGEEVAFESERRRIQADGRDPNLVRWVARDDELSPFDILSVDDDGGPRYIEVKATTAAEPDEPFEMSAAELRFAIAHRDRHFVYRVVNIKDRAPGVFRYRDPIGALAAAPGALRLSKARLSLPSPQPLD